MAEVERHLVKTDMGYVHVRTSGNGAAGQPHVLLLHQVPASGRMWAPVMDLLGEQSCVAPDNLNLGESDRTPRTLTLEEHAEYLWQVAQSLRPGPMIIVGHHTGAAIAAAMTAAHGDEIVGNVLIGYPYYSSWRERLAKYERLNPAGTQADGSGVASAWSFIHRAFEEDSDPDLIFEAFADRMRAGRVWYEGYVALWNSDLEGLAGAVAAHPGKKVLVAPENDILSKKADICAELLGSELLRTPGGAFVLTEHPEIVADLVRDFVAGCRA